MLIKYLVEILWYSQPMFFIEGTCLGKSWVRAEGGLVSPISPQCPIADQMRDATWPLEVRMCTSKHGRKTSEATSMSGPATLPGHDDHWSGWPQICHYIFTLKIKYISIQKEQMWKPIVSLDQSLWGKSWQIKLHRRARCDWWKGSFFCILTFCP